MPTSQIRALAQGAPRAHKQRAPLVRQRGYGLVALRRCPVCGANLRHAVPVPETSVEVSEVVARAVTSKQATALSAAQVAGVLQISASSASTHLARAVRDGLLRRTRHTRLRGGAEYHYQPHPLLIAYLPQDSLAQELQRMIAQMARVS